MTVTPASHLVDRIARNTAIHTTAEIPDEISEAAKDDLV